METTAALAPALAEATRTSGKGIAETCSDAIQRMDHEQDAVMQARMPELYALAEQVTSSRASLAKIRTDIERFHTQLHTASEHIGKLQDRSNTLNEHLSEQETNASTLTKWIEGAVIAPSTVRLLRDTNVDDNFHGWVKAVHMIEHTLRTLNEYEATQDSTATPGSARAQARDVAEQCKNLVRCDGSLELCYCSFYPIEPVSVALLFTNTRSAGDWENLPVLGPSVRADSHFRHDNAADPPVICSVAPQSTAVSVSRYARATCCN